MQARQRVRSIFPIGLLLGCCLAGHAQTITATPNVLNLDTTSGPDILVQVTLTTASTTPISFTVWSANGISNTSWLTVAPTNGKVVAGGPVNLTFHANSAGLSPNSIYNVDVPILANGTKVADVQVNYNIVVVTGLTVSPQGTSWSYAPGGTPPPPQVVKLSSSASTFNAVVGANSPWLVLGVPNPPVNFIPQSGLYGYPTSGGFTLVFNQLAMLTGGTTYYGNVTVTDANGNMATLGVSLVVTGAGTAFALSPSSLNLQTSGPSVTATVNTSAPNPTAFTTSSTVISPEGAAWLTVAPASGVSPQSLTVTADPRGLPAGQYSGTVTAVAGALSSSVTVNFTVNPGAGGGGNVVSTPASLSIPYNVGAVQPQAQSLVISNQTAGTASISFTVTPVVPAGSPNWLSAAVQGGGSQGSTQTASATVLVSVNPQGLPPATYTGTVNISPAGGNVLGVPVTLIVQNNSTVTATPLQLSFSYQVGGTVPPAQQVQISGNAPSLPFAVVTSTSSGGNWLMAGASGGVTSATANTPVPLNVSVNPGTLGVGNYQGTLTIAGSGSASGTTNISVSLTITALLPSITSVQHAASFASGPVAPGEIVSIFGTSIGPATPVGTTLDPTTGKVSTNIGNVQVLFNGTPAPLTYVSATQINCVVPYEFAQVTSPYVQVKYLSQGSNTFNLQQASTAPGIFAASGGAGQGAILNGDSSYNSSSNPAAKGSTIQVYLTGEGQLVPAGVTGSVTCSAGCATLAQIPKPALAVAALINGQPATIAYYGEAAGFVSGVLQVNVTIPPGTPSGAASLVISVGGNNSQNGVTVAIQ